MPGADGIPVDRIGDGFEIIRRDEPRADEELQRVLVVLPLAIGPHHAGHGVAVGDPDRLQAERRRLRHIFLRMRGAAQEGEIGRDGELGVGP